MMVKGPQTRGKLGEREEVSMFGRRLQGDGKGAEQQEDEGQMAVNEEVTTIGSKSCKIKS